MMHDPRHFSNPHSFIPERWLPSEQGNETCVKEAWVPFSHGRYNCIGRPFVLKVRRGLIVRLALFEMMIILTRLIWEFDLELVEEQGTPVLNAQNQTTSELKVRFKRINAPDLKS